MRKTKDAIPVFYHVTFTAVPPNLTYLLSLKPVYDTFDKAITLLEHYSRFGVEGNVWMQHHAKAPANLNKDVTIGGFQPPKHGFFSPLRRMVRH